MDRLRPGGQAHRTAEWGPSQARRGELRQGIRLAFSEFLTLPALIVLGFLALALLTLLLDESSLGLVRPVRAWLQGHVFGDQDAAMQLLATTAQSVITVTSITFSLLLVTLQQTAASVRMSVMLGKPGR